MEIYCRAELNFAARDGLRGGITPVEVDIRNARVSALPGWQTNGFELVRHESAVTDWSDNEAIANVHYAEAETLARRLTDCDAAAVSDHVTRSATATKRPREQDPVRLVHSDFAAGYDDIVRTAYRKAHGRGAATLARTGLRSSDIEGASRIVMLQLWRNVGAALMELPVAFCDSRTVSPADGRPFPYTGYVAGGFTFDALAIAAPRDAGQQHWYVHPEMVVDEVVVFRTYDSELVAQDKTWFTPHSAFQDPHVPSDAPPRQSVELRVMCLFF